MGIIKKQGIQGTILLYVGVFIGFITSSVLFPRILKEEEIGLINTLLAYSIVLAEFATLGFNNVITRMFSYFRNYSNKHNGFFFFVLSVILLGSLLAVLLYYLLRSIIIKHNIENSPLFVEYIDYLIPLIIFSLIFYLLDNYSTVLFKAVRGIFLKELLQKVLILLALIIFYFKFFNLQGFVVAYVIALSLPAIILIVALIIEKEFVIKPNFSFVSRDLAKSMISVSFFGVLACLVSSANMQIDKAMTSSMLNLESTGIYSTVVIYAAFIKIPSRALLKIASAVIAEAWKRNDVDEIEKVYKETSYNQYLVALLVLVGLWANIHNVFEILPEGFEKGKYIILIIGIAYTFEMATGAANQVIVSSKYYRYQTLFVSIMLIMAVLLNLIFIPILGIIGVALATAINVVSFTIMKLIFIKYRFKMNPFNARFILVSIIGVSVYLISSLIPVIDNYILDILIRSSAIMFLYLLFLFLTNASTDLNKALYKFLRIKQDK